ncbi:alpha/beta fold hydrolase [Actinokineospora sp.]|uniref:alpha/beta fold hydrolase n=1 Tax=Actinokineospora sp. TaxID=1872133 RepID=UPI003D6A2EF2
MADSFRTSDDLDLHVVETGPSTAPVTVLLAHGWTSSHAVWDHVVAELGPDVRTIRYDHRGHGRSAPAPVDAATIAHLADDMAELIMAKAPTGKLVLVGHSMGGMTMMALGERHPEITQRVSAALFVSTSSGRMSEVTFGLPKPLVRAYVKRAKRPTGSKPSTAPRRPRKRAVKVEVPAPVQRALSLAVTRWLVFGSRFRMIDVRATADHAAAVHRRTAALLRRSISKHDRVSALDAYAHADVRVLVGDRDRLTPVDHARAIADALPNARFVLYPAAGHMLPYERVREVATQIRRAAAA